MSNDLNQSLSNPIPPQDIMGMHPNTYCMLLHLSQLLNFFGGLGIAAVVIMWAIKKDQYPQVDRHGKLAMNWIISSLIYAVASLLLCLVIVGIPMLLALAVVSVVFPIIAGIKANDGIEWKYPLCIQFFKIDQATKQLQSVEEENHGNDGNH